MRYSTKLFKKNDIFIAHRFKDRAEWLSYRIKGIGGSDASTTIGMNPWKTNQQLYREKMGLTQSPDISNQSAVKYGSEAEEPLRQLYALDFPKYEVNYINNVILQSVEHPFLLYSPDGLLREIETGRKGILEIKTTEILQSMQKESWKDQIPQNYYIQVLHGLLVTGYDFVELKAQLKRKYKKEDGTEEIRIEIKHYHFERSEVEDDLKFLLENEKKFNQCIVDKKEPNLLLNL